MSLPKLAFIHVPRCGGTSVRRALSEVYSPERVWLDDRPPVPGWQGFDCVAGHVTWDQVKDFHGAKVVTMLRNPVDIAESHLNRWIGLLETGVPLQPRLRIAAETALKSPELYIQLFPHDRETILDFFGTEEDASRFAVNQDLVGFTGESELFFSELSMIVGSPLNLRKLNEAPRRVIFSRRQRTECAWKLRQDLAFYSYLRALWTNADLT